MQPTRLAVLIAATGFVPALLPALGYPRAWQALFGFWASLVLIHLVDARLCASPEGVRFSLSTPDRLQMDESGVAELRVTFAGRGRPSRCEAILGASDLLDSLEQREARPSGSGTCFKWDLRPVRRGTARLDSVNLRYRSPLGLWSVHRTLLLSREILVIPNLSRVKSVALRFFNDRSFRSGLKIERYRGDGTEFESLKEFSPGDDHRAMDWKASARHRRLYCRQYQAERNHQVIFAVDSGHLMSEPVRGQPRLDHAISSALHLSYVCLASGDQVGLFSFDSRVGPGLSPVSGVSSMRSLAQVSSAIGYSAEETNFTLGLTTLAQRVRRRSLVILLTDFVDTVTAELMIENLERIGRKHLVVFVSIKDPLLHGVSSSEPETASDLNRAVVAGSLLRDRELVHLRLRRGGIQTLDVEPGVLGAVLINRYLDIKRRELVA